MSKILIAEDERDIRELIAFTLRFAGFEVFTTTNGEEALNILDQVQPDLVLLDIRMPRVNGYQVCQKIKTNPETQHIPVVFLSAKGQESEVLEGYSVGADEYIVKPFSPDQLIERVKEILKK